MKKKKISKQKNKLNYSNEKKYNRVRYVISRNMYVGKKQKNRKIVSATSMTSALECAEILNFKCKEKNFPLPNPDIKCLNPKNSLNRLKRKFGATRSEVKKGFIGQKLHDGVKAVSSSLISALECAQKKKGFFSPNPKIKYLDPCQQNVIPRPPSGYNCVYYSSRNKNYTGHKCCVIDKKRIRVYCCGQNALECAQILNYKCKEKGWYLPNPEINCLHPSKKKKWKLPPSGYYNVTKQNKQNRYRGMKTQNKKTITCVAKTALECAKKLNLKCKEIGFEIPNPNLESPKVKIESNHENLLPMSWANFKTFDEDTLNSESSNE